MTCPTCKSEHVYRLIHREAGRWECNFCPDKLPMKRKTGAFIRHISGVNSNSRRTAAHDMDISRRRLAEDGRTVIRV